MIHTRSHDMSADIYTKGFTDVALFNRLRSLISVYSPYDLVHNLFCPAPLGADKLPCTVEGGLVVENINTQYCILLSGKSLEQDDRKPVKVKLPKTKVKARPPPKSTAVTVRSQLCVFGPAIAGEASTWFARFDFQTDRYVRSTPDGRCPPWSSVRCRRTYNLSSGKLLQHLPITGDEWQHEPISSAGTLFNIVTFLYVRADPSPANIADEEALVLRERPDVVWPPVVDVVPDVLWTLVLVPPPTPNGVTWQGGDFVGAADNCTVLVVSSIGDQVGVAAAAASIRPLVGTNFILVYLGAPSTVSPLSSSSFSSPPFNHSWWSALGQQHKHLCEALHLCYVETPYLLELFVGSSRKFSMSHFSFIDNKSAEQFRVKLMYNNFVYTFETNAKHLRNSVMHEHDKIFGLPTHTRNLCRLSHVEHSLCVGYILAMSIEMFFDRTL